jgi:hypothetical protein
MNIFKAEIPLKYDKISKQEIAWLKKANPKVFNTLKKHNCVYLCPPVDAEYSCKSTFSYTAVVSKEVVEKSDKNQDGTVTVPAPKLEVKEEQKK